MERYKEITKELLDIAYKKAWSVENMAGHDAEGRDLTYIGSTREKDIVTDYFLDSEGKYWYKTKAFVDGKVTSIEMLIFGCKEKKVKKKLTFADASRW